MEPRLKPGRDIVRGLANARQVATEIDLAIIAKKAALAKAGEAELAAVTAATAAADVEAAKIVSAAQVRADALLKAAGQQVDDAAGAVRRKQTELDTLTARISDAKARLRALAAD